MLIFGIYIIFKIWIVIEVFLFCDKKYIIGFFFDWDVVFVNIDINLFSWWLIRFFIF